MPTETDLSPYTDHSRSSKSPLYGIPAVVGTIFQINKSLTKFIELASIEYQKEIRESARLSWGPIADTIFVAYDSETEALNIFSTHPDAQRLEYGDINTPPQPVLRSAAFNVQERFARRVSDLISEALR